MIYFLRAFNNWRAIPNPRIDKRIRPVVTLAIYACIASTPLAIKALNTITTANMNITAPVSCLSVTVLSPPFQFLKCLTDMGYLILCLNYKVAHIMGGGEIGWKRI